MTVDAQNISNEIFKLLQGYGYTIDKMYSLEGTEVSDPSEARRLYNKKLSLMITIDDSDSVTEIIVNVGINTNIKDIRDMLDIIRNIAVKNLAEYTLNTFGKGITPQDFAQYAKSHQNSEKLGEGLSRLAGSSLESFQTLDDDVKLVIQHNNQINPEVRGARSRHIKNLFIENSDGERFKFPVNNLTSARVMTRYINEGGQPGDNLGRYIIELAEEKEFLKKAKRQLLNKHARRAASKRFTDINKKISDLNKKRKFREFVEEFDNRMVRMINESDFEKFGPTELEGLEEELVNTAPAKTLVHVIISERYSKKADQLLENMINELKEFPTELAEQCADDPLMPAYLKFHDLNEKLRYQLEYYGKALGETHSSLVESVFELSNIVDYLKPSRQKFLEKVLTTGFESARL